MDDTISRRAAIDIVDGWFKRIGLNGDICVDGLRQLPSATDKNVGTKLGIDPYKIERAIRGLTEWQKHVQTESDIDRDISVAVEALKAQLGTDFASLGTDCISRQAAIDIAKELTITLDGYEMSNQAVMNYCAEIMQLPPIQPKRGKWILKSYRWECNQCGCLIRRVNPFKGNEWNYNFCPNCGAEMRGEQDG